MTQFEFFMTFYGLLLGLGKPACTTSLIRFSSS